MKLGDKVGEFGGEERLERGVWGVSGWELKVGFEGGSWGGEEGIWVEVGKKRFSVVFGVDFAVSV